jgi:hypothetical protein
MPTCPSVRKHIVTVAFLAMSAACGSSDNPSPKLDSGLVGGDAPVVLRDAAVLRDTATLSDLAPDAPPAPVDATDGAVKVPDAPALSEAGTEAGLPRLDLAPQTIDSNGLDATATEAGRQNLDTTSAGVDGADIVDAAADQADAPSPDDADAPFQPGPATPIVVNSANTAQYNQGDGTWKVFYFEAEAGQIYVVSGLSGIVRGYLSTSPSVSPTNYQIATDTSSGTLLLTAPASQRYYLAVGVSGGGASGSFQVADGGKPIALGTTTLSLTPADAGDAYYVYRFPITTGHSYTLNLQGPSQPNIGLSVAPRPERSSLGEFSYSIWGKGGSLPFTDAIPATSVADSTSGFYFVNIRIMASITFTISIAETP